MYENVPTSIGEAKEDGRVYLDWDWYAGGIPDNVELGANVYIDTSYGFAACLSELKNAVRIGEASGAYDRASFVIGARGRVVVGDYTVLNGTYIVCNLEVNIGNHCLLAWGSVISDCWSGAATLEQRRAAMYAAAEDSFRRLQSPLEPKAVTLQDNCWVGFDAVILPGVTLGRGCIVGSKTVISEDVPAYAVVVGDPPRVIRFLEPDDTDEQRLRALNEYARH
jgi:acetyltransferase-like isoleucine patch superfamily enzyme